jgi:hypothetical protein
MKIIKNNAFNCIYFKATTIVVVALAFIYDKIVLL